MPKTIQFCGQEVTVPFVGYRLLRRAAAVLKTSVEKATVPLPSDTGETVEMPLAEVITRVPLHEYSTLFVLTFQLYCTNVAWDQLPTDGEQAFFGLLGDLMGMDSIALANAPTDDINALVMAIYEQERETQTGKSLIHILRSGLGIGQSMEPESKSESPLDTTTPAKKERQPATSGKA